jgi:hypothetical protein
MSKQEIFRAISSGQLQDDYVTYRGVRSVRKGFNSILQTLTEEDIFKLRTDAGDPIPHMIIRAGNRYMFDEFVKHAKKVGASYIFDFHDKFGYTPMTIAALLNPSFVVVLNQCYGQALMTYDLNGDVLLTSLMHENKIEDFEIVLKLMKPEEVKCFLLTKNTYGRTSIHTACTSESYYKALKIILEIMPKYLTKEEIDQVIAEPVTPDLTLGQYIDQVVSKHDASGKKASVDIDASASLSASAAAGSSSFIDDSPISSSYDSMKASASASAAPSSSSSSSSAAASASSASASAAGLQSSLEADIIDDDVEVTEHTGPINRDDVDVESSLVGGENDSSSERILAELVAAAQGASLYPQSVGDTDILGEMS